MEAAYYAVMILAAACVAVGFVCVRYLRRMRRALSRQRDTIELLERALASAERGIVEWARHAEHLGEQLRIARAPAAPVSHVRAVNAHVIEAEPAPVSVDVEETTERSMRPAELAAEVERAEQSESNYRAWIASLPEEAEHETPADEPTVAIDLSGICGQGKAA